MFCPFCLKIAQIGGWRDEWLGNHFLLLLRTRFSPGFYIASQLPAPLFQGSLYPALTSEVSCMHVVHRLLQAHLPARDINEI